MSHGFVTFHSPVYHCTVCTCQCRGRGRGGGGEPFFVHFIISLFLGDRLVSNYLNIGDYFLRNPKTSRDFLVLRPRTIHFC